MHERLLFYLGWKKKKETTSVVTWWGWQDVSMGRKEGRSDYCSSLETWVQIPTQPHKKIQVWPHAFVIPVMEGEEAGGSMEIAGYQPSSRSSKKHCLGGGGEDGEWQNRIPLSSPLLHIHIPVWASTHTCTCIPHYTLHIYSYCNTSNSNLISKDYCETQMMK